MTVEIHTNNPDSMSIPREEMRHELSRTDGPIIEVGGTTKELINPRLLPFPPITTDLNKFRHKPVDIIADGKNLPLKDHSVAVIMADHIGTSDLYGTDIRQFIDYGEEGSRESRQGLVHRRAANEYAKFLNNPDEKVLYNLRIQFMKEMSRVVRPGGLVVFESLNELDTKVAEKLGWKIEDVFDVRQQRDLTHVFNVIFRVP